MKTSLLVLLNALPISVLTDPASGQQELVAMDHIVYATPDLQRSVTELEQRLGVRASPGGISSPCTDGGARFDADWPARQAPEP